MSGQPTRAVALLVAGAFFMETLDGTVIATALPSMAASFGSAPTAPAIGMTAYLVTLAAFIPASGWVADRYGPRGVFAGAVALFTVASILCAASQTLMAFTLARIAQGGAGALMVPVGRLVVLRGTPRGDLVRAIAILTWPGLLAPVVGPPLGGFITAALSWRWIFLVNVPFGIAGCVLALRLVDRERPARPPPFDGRGFVLGGTTLASLLYALDEFGRAEADVVVAVGALAASVGLGALAIRHARRVTHPLVPLDPFGVPSFAMTMRGGSLSRAAISTMPFLLPLLFQTGLRMGPVIAGLFVLWYGLANLAIKPATSVILRRFGFRRVLVVNTVLSAASIGACALIDRDTPILLTGALLMAAGASRSVQFTALNTLAFAEVPSALTAAASTLFNVAFQLSVGLGVAVGAITLRVLDALPAIGDASPMRPFHVALLVFAGLALLPLPDALRLSPRAGEAVSGHRR